MKSLKFSFEFTLTLLLLCVICEDSFGYINPSSGYILWQVLLGAIVGLLFFAKRIWFGVRAIFGKEKHSDSSSH
ncbi:MAG: hypothetical protein ACKOA8_05110 [Deltaproteobacteria bacterium]|jgi:hypothetical protein